MKSFVRPSFWRAYERLDDKLAKPRAKRTGFSNKIRIIPHFNSRSLGAMSTSGRCGSAHNIAQVGERRGDTISWAWIGTHNEFDKLFG